MERQAGIGGSKQPVSDKEPPLMTKLKESDIRATDGVCIAFSRLKPLLDGCDLWALQRRHLSIIECF